MFWTELHHCIFYVKCWKIHHGWVTLFFVRMQHELFKYNKLVLLLIKSHIYHYCWSFHYLLVILVTYKLDLINWIMLSFEICLRSSMSRIINLQWWSFCLRRWWLRMLYFPCILKLLWVVVANLHILCWWRLHAILLLILFVKRLKRWTIHKIDILIWMMIIRFSSIWFLILIQNILWYVLWIAWDKLFAWVWFLAICINLSIIIINLLLVLNSLERWRSLDMVIWLQIIINQLVILTFTFFMIWVLIDSGDGYFLFLFLFWRWWCFVTSTLLFKTLHLIIVCVLK